MAREGTAALASLTDEAGGEALQRDRLRKEWREEHEEKEAESDGAERDEGNRERDSRGKSTCDSLLALDFLESVLQRYVHYHAMVHECFENDDGFLQVLPTLMYAGSLMP